MSVPNSMTNWNTVIGRVINFTGWDFPISEPCMPPRPWSFVQCKAQDVVGLQLGNLGLEGTLPSQLSQLEKLRYLNMKNNSIKGPIPETWTSSGSFPYLTTLQLQENLLTGSLPALIPGGDSIISLNLSVNAFTGFLPEGWNSKNISVIDLSDNQISGPLPNTWGEDGLMSNLSTVVLFQNQLSGSIPLSWMNPTWSSELIPQVLLMPGNQGLCGVVYPLSIDLLFRTSAPTSTGTPYPSAEEANGTSVPVDRGVYPTINSWLTWSNLFGKTPGLSVRTDVLLTNSMGSCLQTCSGRPPTATIKTNAFALALERNISLLDLVAVNPELQQPWENVPGNTLTLPCYVPGHGPENLGSDAAWNKFAGGNQAPLSGGVGAMLAGAAVQGSLQRYVYTLLPNGEGCCPPYKGSELPYNDNNTMNPSVTVQEPVWWMVDIGTSLPIELLHFTTGDENSGLDIYIGDDDSDIFLNTAVATDLTVGFSQTTIVDVNSTASGQFVILYAGFQNQGNLSLVNMQVYPAVSNAAANLQLIFSSPGNGTINPLNGDCVVLRPDSRGSIWGTIDLGFVSVVGAVSLDLVYDEGGDERIGRTPEVMSFVTLSFPSRGPVLPDAVAGACSSDPKRLLPGSTRVNMPCNQEGRHMTFRISNVDIMDASISICNVGVYIRTELPTDPLNPDVPSSGLSTGAITGIVIGSIVGVLALVAVAVYILFRKRTRETKIVSKEEYGTPSSPSYVKAAKLDKMQDSAENGSNGLHGSPDGSTVFDPSGTVLCKQSSVASSLEEFSGWNVVKWSDLKLGEKLGAGSFGEVWTGTYLQTRIAIKRLLTRRCGNGSGRGGSGNAASSPTADALEYDEVSAYLLEALQKEAGLISSLRHPNIVQFLGVCLKPPCILMELCARKSVDEVLAKALQNPKTSSLSWLRLLSMANDAAKGMLYLHSMTPPIVHRDLKSPNLLVDANWRVKVSDFNLSRAAAQDSRVSSLTVTNPRWLSPESLRGEEAGLPADVWSMGVVMWELATWHIPWEGYNPFTIITMIQSEKKTLPIPDPKTLPAGMLAGWDEYVSLMKDCWKYKPSQRPTMEQVVTRLRKLLALEAKRVNGMNV